MCGKADDAHPPAPQPVRLKEIPPTAQSRSPSSARDRPPPSHRERPASSTQRHRPASASVSSARPSTSKSSRPSSSSTRSSSSRRAPKTAGGERHSSSHGDRSRRTRPRSQFPSIQEYPEDRTIINSVAELETLIEQHAANYYSQDRSRGQGGATFDDPQTRHAAIRKYIAEEVINSIIIARNSSADVSPIAHRISEHVRDYSDPRYNDAQRRSHIVELCKLGDEIRGLMAAHPADWEFGSWDEAGFILVFPTLLRDGEQVVARRIFRTF